jgi:hypothetical protein
MGKNNTLSESRGCLALFATHHHQVNAMKFTRVNGSLQCPYVLIAIVEALTGYMGRKGFGLSTKWMNWQHSMKRYGNCASKYR